MTTAELKLRVVPRSTPSVLLDLGHASKVTTLRLTATRMLSQDVDSHWVLWNYQTGTIIAQGEAGCDYTLPACSRMRGVDLAGSTLVIDTPRGLQLRSATDGHVIATVVTPYTAWKLAVDGSYIAEWSAGALSIWSTTDGSQIFTNSGNYGVAECYGAPGELRVGGGPANTGRIQYISVPGGVVTQSPPFFGQFYEWFGDGEHYIAGEPDTFTIFSRAGMQQDTVNTSNVVALAGSDLTQGTLAALPHPVLFQSSQSAYAAVGTANWVLASELGVVADGASLSISPRNFSLGAPISIAGGSQYFALSLASGGVRYYDVCSRTITEHSATQT